MFGYFYAFVNEFISYRQFENWVYTSLELLSQVLCNESELFTELLECDYYSENAVEHLKNVLRNKFDILYTPESYNEFINSADENLKNLMENNVGNIDNITFNCIGIDTYSKLQKKIQIVFNFPEWYGMNWNAFNDLIYLPNMCTIKIINIQEMKNSIPDETEIFLKLLRNNLPENGKLIFE